MNRRNFLTAAISTALGVELLITETANAGIRQRHRRRVRRRIRRRIRHRAFTRRVLGRSLWVVPVGMAVGWELMHDDRVVIVKETKFVERDNTRVEVAVVQDSAGKTEEVELSREDNTQNSKALKGSVLPDDDKSTPGVDDEVEEESES